MASVLDPEMDGKEFQTQWDLQLASNHQQVGTRKS